METKKNPGKEVTTRRTLFLSTGLCISLLLVLSAFELKTRPVPTSILPMTESAFSELVTIEATSWPVPQKPPVQFPEIVEVTNDTPVPVEPVPYTFDPETSTPTVHVIEMPEETVETSGFIVTEEPASFPGGLQNWQQFLSKNIRYPRFAQRNNIEGKVHLSFYVDSTGKVSDIKVTRGIGGGCDEEAIRVLKLSPEWNPGLQRGVAVKSPMSIYISFKLQ
jgi:protein TonB